MKNFVDKIVGKKVVVFGLGRQGGGVGDAAWLSKHGAIVKIADRDQTLAPGGEKEEDVHWADIIIKNPAVPDDHPLLLLARKLGKPVLTSIAVFVKYAPLIIIGITGTRGKSTTTALVTKLLERAFPGRVITGGNIPGTSGLSLLDEVKGKQYAVLELSSFQLHNFHELKISPQIAVLTNLYPDHLNRYTNMKDYQKDKEALVAYQKPKDLTLYNQDNPGAVAMSRAARGERQAFSAAEVADWPSTLPGLHNRENIAAMWAVGKALGVSRELCKQVVQDFHGLSFRQEKIKEIGGVTYINDTTATTPIAALAAINAQTQPTILICGGATKNLPEDELIQAITDNPHIEHVIFLGSETIPEFTQAVSARAPHKILGQVESMADAVTLAAQHAAPGSTVLLSPGFTSFDLFQNEFDRGRQFNDAVNKL